MSRGYLTEGTTIAESLLARSNAPTVGRARALITAGMLGFLATGDVPVAGVRAREAVQLSRALGERGFLATALNVVGTGVRFEGDHEGAVRIYQEALDVAGNGELWW